MADNTAPRSSPTRLSRRIIVSVVAASLALVTHVTAQPVAPTLVTVDHADADGQFRRAEALRDVRADWNEAAILYQESARLRSADDPLAVYSLRMGSHLLYTLGRLSLAGEAMEQAGDLAVGQGDAFTAAECYLDAAFVAQEQGDEAEADRLGTLAQLVVASPGVPSAQRGQILDRIRERGQMAQR